MLAKIIDLSLRHRSFVIFLAMVAVVVGAEALRRLPVDAFPDTTPVQVQVNTQSASLSPEEMEQQVTRAVELSLGGLPGLLDVRSISKPGLSQVTATFSDATDLHTARQLVEQKLSEVRLPEGLEGPSLGPLSTGLGEVFHYLVRSGAPWALTGEALTELRSVQNWTIEPQLRTVRGVAEVNSWGGLEKAYQVAVDPLRLLEQGVSLQEVTEALRQSNANVGGGVIEGPDGARVVQGAGLLRSVEEIGRLPLRSPGGRPVRIADVATVEVSTLPRRAAVTEGGRGEVVLGLGFSLPGSNGKTVTTALEERLRELAPLLPPDVVAEPVYERTRLVDHVLSTVKTNLFEGALLVIAVLFAFLGSWRAGLIVAAAIPLSMLFAGNLMLRFGIAGSLMSLGAIDFGLIVDSSVVMVENCVRRVALDRSGRSRVELVKEAALEVRRPTLLGELIIMTAYLPVLTLEGIEGKLFRPMALTVIFALAGSMILSVTLMPALASCCLPRRPRHGPTRAARWAAAFFRPLLAIALERPRAVVAGAVAITAGAGLLALQLGTEFVPRLEEGTLVVNTVRLSSVSLAESVRYGGKIEALLLERFPDEIERIWTRTGTPEIATDPMGVEVSDVFLALRPREDWKAARTQSALATEIAAALSTLPGMRAILTQPIEMRLREMTGGVRGDVGVKLFGDDLQALEGVALEVAAALRSIPGAADVVAEQVTGLPKLEARIREDALARLGVPRSLALDWVEAVGGIHVGDLREGDRRLPLVVRLAEGCRRDPAALGDIVLATKDGARVPLSALLELRETHGPAQIQREWGRRRVLVQCNVRGRDVGTFVEEARRLVAPLVRAPLEARWSGEHERLESARSRLSFTVPLTFALMLLLLAVSFGSLRDALLVFSGAIFARVGGVVALWVRGMPLSISAAIGFMALAGAAILEGLILVSTIRRLMAAGLPKRRAIEEARILRLRPVLMTALVAGLGFVPMAFSTGVGAEVQRPLATVVVFGMAADVFLTLLVLPSLYLLFGKPPPAGVPGAEAVALTREGETPSGSLEGPAAAW